MLNTILEEDREIDVILRDDEIIPLEVKETVRERDLIRFKRLMNYIM
ncbi:MAG: hypothetical protein ACTSVA_01835 [Candidatus Njordarchaeales archaeon]